MKKDLVSLVVGRGVQAILTILLLKLMTTKLPQSEVAQYYFVVATTSWFALLIINPVGMWINRHINEWRAQYSWGSIFKYLLSFYALVGVFAGVAGLGARLFLPPESTITPSSSFLMVFGGILFLSFYQALAGYQNILGSRVTYGILAASGHIIIFSVALAVFLFDRPEVKDWFLLLFIGNFLAMMLFVLMLRREFFAGEQKPATFGQLINNSALVSFCLPMVGVTLAVWTQTQSYRLFIGQSGNLEFLALASVGLGLVANITGTVETLIQQYLLPDYFRSLSVVGGDANEAWAKMFRSALVVLVFSSAGIIFFATALLRILTQPDYLTAARYVRWGAIAEFFRSAGGFLYLRYVGEKSLKKAVPIYVTAAVINVGFFASSVIFTKFTEELLITGLISGSLYSFLGLARRTRAETGWHFPMRYLKFGILVSLPLALGLGIMSDTRLSVMLAGMALAGFYGIVTLQYVFKRKLL